MKNNYPLLFLNICFLLFIPIFTVKALPLPWEAEDMPQFIYYSFEFGIIIAGLITFGVLVFAGFRYMTSAGNPTTMSDSRDQIISAFLGLSILLGSWILFRTIDPHLVKLEPPALIGRNIVILHGLYTHRDADGQKLPPDRLPPGVNKNPEPQKREVIASIANVPDFFGNFEPIDIEILTPPTDTPLMKLSLYRTINFGFLLERVCCHHLAPVDGSHYHWRSRYACENIVGRSIVNHANCAHLPKPRIKEPPHFRYIFDDEVGETPYKRPFGPTKSIELEIYTPFDFTLDDEPDTIKMREGFRWSVNPFDPCAWPGANTADIWIETELVGGETQRVWFTLGEELPPIDEFPEYLWPYHPYLEVPRHTYAFREVPRAISKEMYGDISWPATLIPGVRHPPAFCYPPCRERFSLKSDWFDKGTYTIRVNAWWWAFNFKNERYEWHYDFIQFQLEIEDCP